MLLGQVTPIETPQTEWTSLLPLLVLTGGALLLMVVSALTRDRLPRGTFAWWTVATAAAAVVCSAILWSDIRDEGPSSAIAGAIGIDGFSVLITVAICAALALAALLTDGYLRREDLEGPEVYVLMMLSAVGGVIMASANDLIVMFLGLETLSIAIYVMAGSHLRRIESQEAAVKYFVLGAFSSAFLLYGIALVYGATGSTSLLSIREYLSTTVLLEDTLLLAGFALLLVGLGFKVSAVPFHAWTPDAYQGAPTPVTSFMASAAKAAAFGGLLRVFYVGFGAYEADWRPMVWLLSVLTMVVGAVLAVVQTDVKRMLAYSSINHAGFILVGVEAASADGTAAALFYVLAYTFMVVGSFGVATIVGRRGDAAHTLDDYRGLGQQRPLLAFAFTVFLLAQAGVPLTAGFLAKFYVISAAVGSESYALAIIAMLSASISAFLYLRIIVAMFLGDAPDADVAQARRRLKVPASATVALAAAFVATILGGILPGPAIDFARDAEPALVPAPPPAAQLDPRLDPRLGEQTP